MPFAKAKDHANHSLSQVAYFDVGDSKMKKLRMTVQNSRSEIMQVFVEPEALDFWLYPNEECEIIADKEHDEGKFEVAYTDDGITIYPSRGCGSISVYQNNIELECAHQRPK